MKLFKTNPLVLVVIMGSLLLAPFSLSAQQTTSRHLVVYGQTLSKIARMYGMTVAELKSLNKLTSDGIYPNKELLVIDRLNNQSQQVDRGLSQSQVPDFYSVPEQVTRGTASPAPSTNMGSGIRYKDLTTYDRQRNFVNRGLTNQVPTTTLDDLIYQQQTPAQPNPNVYRSREDVMLDQISRSGIQGQGYDPFRSPEQQSFVYPSQNGNGIRSTNIDIFSPSGNNTNNGDLDADFLKKLNSINSTLDNTSTTPNSGYPILKSKYYRVSAGESIYDVARKFEVSVEQIRLWNGVTDVHQDDVVIVGKYYGDHRTSPGFGYNEPSDNLRLGSGSVGRGGADFEGDVSHDLNRGVTARNRIEDPYLDYPGNISTYKYQPEKSSARYVEYGNFIAYESKMPGDQNLYALHKYLQPGSRVKVEVPGNDKDVSVTIVGYLPADEDAIIALSPSAILALGPHKNTIRIKY